MMSNLSGVVFCSIFVVSIFACEWAVFGDEFEEFDRPELEDEDFFDGIPLLGWLEDSLEGVWDAISLIGRLASFDVPSLADMFGGWLRWIIAVPVWCAITFIIVSLVWI